MYKGRCANANDITALIMEKAYAKLHGCYECLSHGFLVDALMDITGGSSTVKINFDSEEGKVLQVFCYLLSSLLL